MIKFFDSKSYPNYYIHVAEERFDKYKGDNAIFSFYSDILFWQNFGLTFKDITFTLILKENDEVLAKVKRIISNLEKIFKEFINYDGKKKLHHNKIDLLQSEEKNSETNKNFLAYILAVIIDILNNNSK